VAGGRRRRSRQVGTSAFPRLLAGRLCLDFVNTIEDPLGEEREDFLHGYADLVAWSRHVGIVDKVGAGRLHGSARADPEHARRVFDRALALRDSIERVFRSVARGTEAPYEDLDRIQSEHREALDTASLSPTDGGYAWSWPGDDDLRRPLWPVVESAVELLTEGDLSRVKQCPGTGDCGWLFYDASRNGTRRWCSMEGCGSRAKMRRHYAKRRSPR
jgi:predicted RNA-binding Zn ribbon-like protein